LILFQKSQCTLFAGRIRPNKNQFCKPKAAQKIFVSKFSFPANRKLASIPVKHRENKTHSLFNRDSDLVFQSKSSGATVTSPHPTRLRGQVCCPYNSSNSSNFSRRRESRGESSAPFTIGNHPKFNSESAISAASLHPPRPPACSSVRRQRESTSPTKHDRGSIIANILASSHQSCERPPQHPNRLSHQPVLVVREH